MKCEVCNKEFKVGEWTCVNGIDNHVVAEKLYRACDPPQDIGYKDTKGTPLDGSYFGETVICNIPPPKKIVENGEVKYIGEGSVTFYRGRYATTDPERQYWLDKRPLLNRTEEEWQAAWLSQAQKLELMKAQMNAMQQRIEMQDNELLAATKKQKHAVPA